ncbi:MAG: diaminopimelate decarboxylase [Pseudomonadota bacterium]
MTLDSFYTKLGFSINAESHLTLNGVDLTTLIAEDQPVYVMNELLIRQHLQAYKRAFQEYYPKPTTTFYASKAFLNLGMAHVIKQENIGIDVCSEGELFIAQKAGITSQNILLHGNNKSKAELQAAVDAKIYTIVIDSVSEFDLLETIPSTQKISVMLRVNPTVHVDTHPSMATGVYNSKFGLPISDKRTLDLILRLSKSTAVSFAGLHFHIGSQVLDFKAYTDAIDSMIRYLAWLQEHGISIDTLDMGGGLGVDDQEATLDTIERFAKHVSAQFIEKCLHYKVPLPKLAIEPGRSVVSQAGCTLYKIGHIKESDGTTFLAVHGGMSDNMRVALYQAKYNACVAGKMDQPHTKRYKVVGNCCESGDVVIDDILLPYCQSGDILVVFNTGAYSHSMANQFNKHPMPGVVFVGDHAYHWVTKPQTLEDLIRHDVF